LNERVSPIYFLFYLVFHPYFVRMSIKVVDKSNNIKNNNMKRSVLFNSVTYLHALINKTF